ncbi:MAG: hypothetical protein AB1733_02955 [Thermodesulfobacteriota bacterium]
MRTLSAKYIAIFTCLVLCGPALFPLAHNHHVSDRQQPGCNKYLHSLLHAAHAIMHSLLQTGCRDWHVDRCCCVEGHSDECPAVPPMITGAGARDRDVLAGMLPHGRSHDRLLDPESTISLFSVPDLSLPPLSLGPILSVRLLV